MAELHLCIIVSNVLTNMKVTLNSQMYLNDFIFHTHSMTKNIMCLGLGLANCSLKT